MFSTSTAALFVVCLMAPWLGAMGRLVCFYVACLMVASPKGVPGEGFNVPV